MRTVRNLEEPLARWCWRATFAAALLGLAATMVFAWGTLGRPLNDSEGQVLFEVGRIHGAGALYVNPLQGAFDYGPVPARYYVLYPPVWPWLVSIVPFAASTIPLRVFDTAAWLGLFAWIAWNAMPSCRRATWFAAVLVVSVFAIAPFASSARPDTFALVLAGLALTRSIRLGRVDAFSAALFALAPWVKPNIVGMAAGAMLVDLVCRLRRARKEGMAARAFVTVASALLVTLAMFSILWHVSHGAFLSHLRMSTAQPLSFVQWKAQLPGRLQFFGFPALFAAFCAVRSRGDAGVRLALGALVASFAWAVVSAAKIGSSACYWMETCIACVAVLSRADVPHLTGPARVLGAACALTQTLWIEVASVRSTFEAMLGDVPAEERIVRGARTACGARDGDVILADDVGVEFELNGRITAQPFQMTHLVRAGSYPASLWVADVERSEVVGVVVRNDLLERPLSADSVEYDRFPPPLREALKARFQLADREGDWRTYCAKRGPSDQGTR